MKKAPLTYKVIIQNYVLGKKITLPDVVGDGYIPDKDIRFFVTATGRRFETKVDSGVLISFSEARDQIIKANEEAQEVTP